MAPPPPTPTSALTAQPPKINTEEPLKIHAEYLPNIRQVSVQIAISRETSNPPEISLSESRRAVTVSATLAGFGSGSEPDYVSETIKLPARVKEGSRRLLGGAGAGAGADAREFSYRLQVDDAELPKRDALEEHLDSFVPWSAGDMAPSTQLRCAQCESFILDASTGKSDAPGPEQIDVCWAWKDLPSGNWAEMMDFWHCHKPDPPKERDADGKEIEDANSKVKGYGASNQVLATPGTVLVDVATFLVADTDCKNLHKATKERTDNSHLPPEVELVCDKCNTLIGVEDTVAQGWRLFKTSLAASLPSTEPADGLNWEKHPTELVVAAQLLELIERESARRFVIHCEKKDGILVWVFNPDMRYSNASTQHSITSQRAMKVFFQAAAEVGNMLHPEPGKASPLSLEELRLPVDTYEALVAALEASNQMTPPSARTFQKDWRVGILHRFERLKR
ncbi:HECT-type E3 ubiquitin transferase [Aspergillus stella-maris]|uniref:HECT-type E3 ubiquitin transferase n=1 Tax=Aspergillus stella-maris TaxID=1810926 RepID=UPI003CCDC252